MMINSRPCRPRRPATRSPDVLERRVEPPAEVDQECGRRAWLSRAPGLDPGEVQIDRLLAQPAFPAAHRAPEQLGWVWVEEPTSTASTARSPIDPGRRCRSPRRTGPPPRGRRRRSDRDLAPARRRVGGDRGGVHLADSATADQTQPHHGLLLSKVACTDPVGARPDRGLRAGHPGGVLQRPYGRPVGERQLPPPRGRVRAGRAVPRRTPRRAVRGRRERRPATKSSSPR